MASKARKNRRNTSLTRYRRPCVTACDRYSYRHQDDGPLLHRQGLSALLADTYTLYLTTHNFHWNVTGPCSTRCTPCSWRSTPSCGTLDPWPGASALGHHAPGLRCSGGSPVCLMPSRPRPWRWCAFWCRATGRGAHGAPAVPSSRQGRRRTHGRSADPAPGVHEQTAWMLRSLLEE